MQSVKWNIKALFTLSLLLPGMAMSAEGNPFQSTGQDPDSIHLVALADPAIAAPIKATTPASPNLPMVAEMGAAVATDELETYRGGTEVSNASLSIRLVFLREQCPSMGDKRSNQGQHRKRHFVRRA
jgi:hypothetical protein